MRAKLCARRAERVFLRGERTAVFASAPKLCIHRAVGVQFKVAVKAVVTHRLPRQIPKGEKRFERAVAADGVLRVVINAQRIALLADKLHAKPCVPQISHAPPGRRPPPAGPLEMVDQKDGASRQFGARTDGVDLIFHSKALLCIR